MTLAQAVWPRQADQKGASLTRDIALIIAFSLLNALCAQIAIPLPFTPVPITGQTFGVLLTGALLGPRLGALSLLLYLIEGCVGLPFFYGGTFGLAHLMGFTGGYLLSYPLAAGLIGYLATRGWDRKPATMLLTMLLGSIVIYAIAVPWLSFFPTVRHGVPVVPHMGLPEALVEGMYPFLPGDVIKALLAAGLLPAGWKLLGTRR